MKTVQVNHLLLLSFFLSIFACKPATQLQVIKPAAINLPDHINALATIDRSKPSSGFVDVLEGGVTGESIHQDRNGRRRALEVLTATLTRTPRFKVIDTGLEYTGSETGSTFNTPLPWDEIEHICQKFGADAVIAIEKFDSNNFRDVTSRKRKTKDKDGKEIEETVFDAKQTVEVNLGWRIYDPSTKTIIDEVDVTDSGSDSETGRKSDKEARENLDDPRQVTYRVSETAGRKYAERIAPIWITVSRRYYKKTKGSYQEAMAKAGRLFETDNWEGAVDIWQNILSSADADVELKGMASYNMAVACEKRGLLQAALDWAQKSYGEYGNKKGRNYVSTIRNRIQDQEILEQQLKQRT
ncbi:MAG: hypothetical protein KDC53_14710 [Saprospiraceae bacterium]|nr:hypothetical protein [Saprospiraceae bacterium]